MIHDNEYNRGFQMGIIVAMVFFGLGGILTFGIVAAVTW